MSVVRVALPNVVDGRCRYRAWDASVVTSCGTRGNAVTEEWVRHVGIWRTQGAKEEGVTTEARCAVEKGAARTFVTAMKEVFLVRLTLQYFEVDPDGWRRLVEWVPLAGEWRPPGAALTT